ncbi:MAG TPA: hypothetical protein VLA29_03510 [Acidimicrobiia bacterium]|nr:hypothetical protein [Acidimicrobiia bacterium]
MTYELDPQPRRPGGFLGLVTVLCLLLLVVALSLSAPSNGGDGPAERAIDFAPRTTTTTTLQPIIDHNPDPSVRGPRVEASAPGWENLGTSDGVHRSGFEVIDAANGVFVFGGVTGSGEGVPNAAWYRDDVWTTVASARIPSGPEPVVLWTGETVVVYTGTVAAWDPESDEWGVLTFPPQGGTFYSGAPLAGVVADDRTVILGTKTYPSTTGSNVFVAGYGADLGCCFPYQDPPFSLSFAEAHWTGSDILVIGSRTLPNGRPMADARGEVLASLDPDTGVWTVLDPPPFPNTTAMSSTWTDGQLIAWSADGTSARWSETAGWEPLTEVPVQHGDCAMHTVALDGGDVLAMRCGTAALWSADAGGWNSISVPPRSPAWPIDECTPAGHGIDGAVHVWCSNADTGQSFWRFVPGLAKVLSDADQ